MILLLLLDAQFVLLIALFYVSDGIPLPIGHVKILLLDLSCLLDGLDSFLRTTLDARS